MPPPGSKHFKRCAAPHLIEAAVPARRDLITHCSLSAAPPLHKAATVGRAPGATLVAAKQVDEPAQSRPSEFKYSGKGARPERHPLGVAPN